MSEASASGSEGRTGLANDPDPASRDEVGTGLANEPDTASGDASEPGSRLAGQDASESDTASDGTRRASEPDAVGEARDGDAEDAAPAGRWRRRVVAIVVVLVLAGIVLQVLAWQARHSGRNRDHALVDAETTAVVVGDVSNGLSKIFSYAPESTATTEQAAADVLSGRAAEQYRTLFAQVKQRAAADGLTVTSHVVRAGVTRLSGGTAQLLVFLDQTIIRKDQPDGTSAAAQLSVTARLIAGHWRIVDIHAR